MSTPELHRLRAALLELDRAMEAARAAVPALRAALGRAEKDELLSRVLRLARAEPGASFTRLSALVGGNRYERERAIRDAVALGLLRVEQRGLALRHFATEVPHDAPSSSAITASNPQGAVTGTIANSILAKGD